MNATARAARKGPRPPPPDVVLPNRVAMNITLVICWVPEVILPQITCYYTQSITLAETDAATIANTLMNLAAPQSRAKYDPSTTVLPILTRATTG